MAQQEPENPLEPWNHGTHAAPIRVTPVVRRALDSLIGKGMYACFSSIADKVFYDGEAASGAPINTLWQWMDFSSSEKRLKIVAADVEGSHLTLTVENDKGDSAGVWLSVDAASLTPTHVLSAVADGTHFVLHPVQFPHIGMRESDVYCAVGSPEHMNTDELGSDQLVYNKGDLLVYVDHRTRIVTDVQSHQ